MRFSLMASLTLGALAVSGCDPDPNVDFFQEVTAEPGFPGTAGDPSAYANLLAYTASPSCVPSVPRKLDRKTEVRIFRGNGIPPETIPRFVGGLRRYYDYYGVSMFTRHEPIVVPIDHAIVLNESAIMNWMRDVAKVDPNCASSSSPTLACQQAFGAAMMYNVKQFLRAYAEPEQNVINVVLLKRVASLDPSSETADLNWGIAGLGLSQELLNSAGGSDLGTSLADMIDETNFSPTVFIAVNVIDFVLREPDIVIAHEVGHAYGLEHLDPDFYGSNLMNPTAVKCNLPLNGDQIDTIEAQTARYGNLLAGDPKGIDLLSFHHRAQSIIDIVRARVGKLAASEGAAP